MKNIFSLKILLGLGIFLAFNTHAVIIEGSFRGTVNYVSTENGYRGWKGHWDGDVFETPAWGSFWFDTKNLPSYDAPSSTMGGYVTDTNTWFHSIYYVGGKSYNLSDFVVPLTARNESEEGVWYEFIKFDDATEVESFYVIDVAAYVDEHSRYMSSLIEIQSYNERLLTNLKTIPDFDWFWTDHPDSVAVVNLGVGEYTEYEHKYFNVNIVLDEFHIGAKKSTNIPEPSPLYLLLLGAFFILVRRRGFIRLRDGLVQLDQ